MSATPSPSATPDTSIVDALGIAGVSDELALRLGAVASRTGYGLSRDTPLDLEGSRSFAFIQVGTCRDIATGNKTWDGVISTDIAGGATKADAREMNGFLKSTFCPVVRPDPSVAAVPTTSASRPSTVASGDKDGTRGLLSSIAWLNQKYKAVVWSACAKQVGSETFGEKHAWQLSANIIACTDVVELWKNKPIDFTLVFATRVSEKTALSATSALLPLDTKTVSRKIGGNPPYAAHSGSCASIEMNSRTLAKAVHAANPEWSADEKATVVLYGKQSTSDGSADRYHGLVKEAHVGIGGHNEAQDKTITC